jgi:hypothetical protein
VIQGNPRVNQLSNGFPLDALALPVRRRCFPSTPFRNPYVQRWNLSVQRELNLVPFLKFPTPAPGNQAVRIPCQPGCADRRPTSESIPAGPRRFPISAAVVLLQQFPYHSVQTKLEKRYSSGLSFLAAYTFGKSMDEASQASLGFHDGGSFRWAAHPEWEKSVSDFDIRHRFVLSYSYDIPFGRGKHFGGGISHMTDVIIGGWQVMGIAAFQSGTPRTITATTVLQLRWRRSSGSGQRCPSIRRIVGGLWYNPAAFQPARPGRSAAGAQHHYLMASSAWFSILRISDYGNQIIVPVGIFQLTESPEFSK